MAIPDDLLDAPMKDYKILYTPVFHEIRSPKLRYLLPLTWPKMMLCGMRCPGPI